jgi:zinc transporter 7
LQETSPFSPLTLFFHWVNALHNFTDGLAIGATYAAAAAAASSTIDMTTDTTPNNNNNNNNNTTMTVLSLLLGSRGGLASLSVLLHEIPHELGDYCTLLKAGFTKNQAIGAQFATAIAAFMGTALALFLSFESLNDTNNDDDHGNNNAIANNAKLLLVTAGGFLYLAATTLLPQVLQEEASPLQRLIQLAAFSTGIGFLYLVALVEETESQLGEHSHSHHVAHQHPLHSHTEL